MKSWISAFSVSSPISALGARQLQPGWRSAAPDPRGFPFPLRSAPPRLASPRLSPRGSDGGSFPLPAPAPGPALPEFRPAARPGAGAERSPRDGSRPAHPAARPWSGPWSGPSPAQARRGIRGMSNQADPGPAQVGEACLGEEDPNSAHRGARRLLGSRCTTPRTGCVRAGRLTQG